MREEHLGFLTAATSVASGAGMTADADSRPRKAEKFPCPLLEAMRDGVAVLDCETAQIVDVNSTFVDLIGTPRTRLIGLRLHELKQFRDGPIGKLSTDELTANAKLRLTDLSIENPQGYAVWIEFSATACEIQGSTVILCNLRDVTEYRKAQERILEEETQFQGLIEQELTGIYILNLDGTVAHVNARFAALFGYTASEILAKPFTDTILEADKPALEEAFGELVAGTRSSAQMTARVRRKDGGVVDLIAQGSLATYHGRHVVVGVAMDITERKKAERTVIRLNRALRTLNAASAALMRAADEAELFGSMCEVVVNAGGYQLAWIGSAIQDEAKTVKPISVYGHNDGYLDEVQITWSESQAGMGPTGTAIRTGEVQVFQNLDGEGDGSRWRDRARKRGFGSCISLPLKDREATFGALTLYAAEQDAFNSEELELLAELGAQLSYGVSALRDRCASADNARRVQDALEDAVDALSAATEHRDPYTAGHQRRVATLAVAIGRVLGLSDFNLRGLHLAATIHDVGKICVPAEILSRPGILSSEEFAVIKRHAEVGYEIVKGIEFPWLIAEIVRQHHERLDGSGYPRGLKGDEILFEAKILAVADVVEAIMARRPYRAALGVDPALAEIERGRGAIYEAKIVDACLALFREKGFAFL